ncbi:MAG: putative 4-hydroxybenzoate polyprenyltransferase [Actinobacteria bacterium]|nr:putative 4-hydroxybenzoate polyprenyltransferase [Actinomycetota bacterium]
MTSKFIERIFIILDEIRYEQTLFSLPLIFVGALFASQFKLKITQVVLIIIAAATARAIGMLVNRLVDISIDRLNPRTKGRHLASGSLKPSQAIFFSILSFIIYISAAYKLGPVPLKLSWIPVLMFIIYPYTKRFTWGCHFFLGLTHALAPLAGWIAVNPRFTLEPFLLYLTSFFWVSGFDIYYATMDYDFDVKYGVHSVPSRFGIKSVPFFTLTLHLLSLISILLFSFFVNASLVFKLSVLIAGLFVIYNDSVFLKHLGTPRINSYLQRNSYFSVIVFIGALLEFFVRK